MTTSRGFTRRPHFLVRTCEAAPIGHVPGLEGAEKVAAVIDVLLNARTPCFERESRCEVRPEMGGSRYHRGTTKRAPDRVLGGPQSRALSRLIGVDL